jgi:HK97 family phage portal protein
MIWPLNKLFKRNYAVADSWITRMGMPIYTNWTIQKAVKDGYKVNGWVYRSVYLIAKAVSQVKWTVANQDGEFIEKHYLSMLFKKPNPHLSRQDVMELVTAWLELGGNSYLKKVKVGGRTSELWPVSPDRLAPVPAKKIDEWLHGYALDNKTRVEFLPEEIIHHKFFNPANPLLGIAPLEAAARAVDVDNSQQDWNKSAMQNRAVVDGVMSFKREFDSQEQVDKISERLNESMSGAFNARKIKVVGSEAKYQRMGLSPVEMDFANSRKFNREEIFIVFGIPPVYAGVQESATYNNYLTSELVFWFQTVIPLLDDIKDTFNLSFSDELSDSETITYDLSSIKAIRRATAEWTETAKKMHEMGVPFEQLNRVFEFGFNEFQGWDQSHVKVNNANISVDNQDESRAAKYHMIERRAISDEQDKIAKKAEGPVKDIFYNLLQKQQDVIFKDLSEKNLLTVISDSKEAWETELEKLYVDIGVEFGSDMVAEKRGIGDDLKQAIYDYITQGNDIVFYEVQYILGTTSEAVLMQIIDGLDKGLSTKDIQQAIIDTGVFSVERSLMLARTLTGTAANLGQITSARLSGATHKTWSTATFEVRDSHKKMNGKKIKIDEDFVVGGEKAQFPLDNRLSPAQRANCRCTLTYSIED